jgi:hypothetical protein
MLSKLFIPNLLKGHADLSCFGRFHGMIQYVWLGSFLFQFTKRRRRNKKPRFALSVLQGPFNEEGID